MALFLLIKHQPINVYIGEELLDSVIANSERRRSLRSGGRGRIWIF